MCVQVCIYCRAILGHKLARDKELLCSVSACNMTHFNGGDIVAFVDVCKCICAGLPLLFSCHLYREKEKDRLPVV